MNGIGVGVIEYLTLASAATGVCWLLAWRMRKQLAQRPKKPLWVSWGAELFGVLALITVGRVALADWPNVPSGSMEPNLRIGDYLLVNKLAYGPRLPFTNTAIELGKPQRGDVVVFRYPLDVNVLYVKRLIGVPGDVVAYDHGVVSVNGAPFKADIVRDYPDVRPEDRGHVLVREATAGHERIVKVSTIQQGGAVPVVAWRADESGCQVESAKRWRCTVPPGRYLMMGDNRDNSADSRVFGFVDHHEVYGKAVRVLVNFSDFKRSFTPL